MYVSPVQEGRDRLDCPSHFKMEIQAGKRKNMSNSNSTNKLPSSSSIFSAVTVASMQGKGLERHRRIGHGEGIEDLLENEQETIVFILSFFQHFLIFSWWSDNRTSGLTPSLFPPENQNIQPSPLCSSSSSMTLFDQELISPSRRERESTSILRYIFSMLDDVSVCPLRDYKSSVGNNIHQSHLKSSNTSNLWAHLKSWHPEVYDDLCQPTASPPQQVAAATIAKAEERAKKKLGNNILNHWAKTVIRNPVRSEKEVRLLLWLVSAGIPFNAIENPEWRSFMQSYNVQMRGADHLASTILPAVHEHVMHRIHTPLSDLESAAVIIDGWELKHQKMIGVVIQYINPQWKLHTDVIGLLQVNQSHTASTIFSFVDARLQEVLGKETMIAACVSDNGSNYTNASKLISNNEG